jgi:hypothetical protein
MEKPTFTPGDDLKEIEQWLAQDLLPTEHINVSTDDREQINLLRPFIREILGPDLRFEMSGYDSGTGTTTVNNQAILNRFAKFGIYDYTHYLFLDFYKGVGSLYLKYWDTGEIVEIEDKFCGWTTSEIIAQIWILTVGSGRNKRRRE